MDVGKNGVKFSKPDRNPWVKIKDSPVEPDDAPVEEKNISANKEFNVF